MGPKCWRRENENEPWGRSGGEIEKLYLYYIVLSRAARISSWLIRTRAASGLNERGLLVTTNRTWSRKGGAAGVDTYGLALSRVSEGRIIVPCERRRWKDLEWHRWYLKSGQRGRDSICEAQFQIRPRAASLAGPWGWVIQTCYSHFSYFVQGRISCWNILDSAGSLAC